MSFDETLVNRIREYLSDIPNVEEKKMMGGLTFMVNDKMCVGIFKDELMCRIDPAQHETALGKPSCRTMDFTKRPMIGYVLIASEGMRTSKAFSYWMELALAFNKTAKSSKKK